MRLSPDEMIFWQHGLFKLNGTIVFTWALMFVLAVGSKLITRRLSTGLERSRWQSLLEIVVTGIEKQIGDVGLRHPEKYIGFLGTLFLFVALASLCTIIPGFEPPTGSLSTTAALALCVLVAVPFSASRSRDLAATSNPTWNRPSSCCRSTSSAKFRARWRWRSACLAT
jgi:F-type H+-transporting ATPase subunit a